MKDCLFCNISKKKIPSVVVYEDPDFFGFMDIKPVNKGHVLLIPKAHSARMHETDDATIARIFVVAKNLINTIRLNMPCDYVQLNVEGNEVPHFHIHLIPRHLKDGLVAYEHQTYDSQEEIEEYANKIRK
jgi:histidine triad (HIT) family protein